MVERDRQARRDRRRVERQGLVPAQERLVAAALLQQDVAEDARRVRVSLTPRSRALAAKMAPQIEAVYRAIEARIGPDFTERFYATLDELIALLGAGEAPGGEA